MVDRGVVAAGAPDVGASGSTAGGERVAGTAQKGRKRNRARSSARASTSRGRHRSQLRAAAHVGATKNEREHEAGGV